MRLQGNTFEVLVRSIPHVHVRLVFHQLVLYLHPFYCLHRGVRWIIFRSEVSCGKTEIELHIATKKNGFVTVLFFLIRPTHVRIEVFLTLISRLDLTAIAVFRAFVGDDARIVPKTATAVGRKASFALLSPNTWALPTPVRASRPAPRKELSPLTHTILAHSLLSKKE